VGTYCGAFVSGFTVDHKDVACEYVMNHDAKAKLHKFFLSTLEGFDLACNLATQSKIKVNRFR